MAFRQKRLAFEDTCERETVRDEWEWSRPKYEENLSSARKTAKHSLSAAEFFLSPTCHKWLSYATTFSSVSTIFVSVVPAPVSLASVSS